MSYRDFKRRQKAWKDCGYITLSKKGTVLSVVVKKQRYIVNLQQAEEVLLAERNYALVYEFVGENSG